VDICDVTMFKNVAAGTSEEWVNMPLII